MDDISFLVSETFKTVENTGAERARVPETSGILYSLAENESTFVIRGICSRNLKEDHEHLIERKHHETLRVDEDSRKDIFWFETDFWERSEMILELAGQKRFLKENERLSNLSDPHLYWSLTIEPEAIKIDLSGRKKHHSNSIPLGYIGEVSIGIKRFSEILGRDFKNDVIDIRESETNLDLYNKLKDLIQYQNYDQAWFHDYFLIKFDAQKAESLELYLGELQTMLKFWKKILNQVSN